MRTFAAYDYETLCGWMKKRGLGAPPADCLPPTGLIEDNVACGFLIKCDNGFGVLDFFISNPAMPGHVRAVALDDIASALIDTARRAGITNLKCDTDIQSVYKLAVKHGFHAIGSYKSMVRGI